MKAFAITARDSQPALQDLPQPQPAAGEVLVKVEAASVNGFDLSVAAGYVWDMLPHEFPVVLGRDLVGAVTAAGDGDGNLEPGDRVAGVIPGVALGPRTGSFAEQVSLPASAPRTPSTTPVTSPPRCRPSPPRVSTRRCTLPATPPPSAESCEQAAPSRPRSPRPPSNWAATT